MTAGAQKTFDVHYPADYAIKELAGTTVNYDVTVKAVRKRIVPELDDEFAKDLGDFASLDALKARVREDLEHEARHESDRELRAELMKQLATRVTFEVPQALLEREIDRRVEEFVRRLIDQQIDPMKTNINWEDFRERQREAAAEAVRGALVLDEVARREVGRRVARRDRGGDRQVCRADGPDAGGRPREAGERGGHRAFVFGVAPGAGD